MVKDMSCGRGLQTAYFAKAKIINNREISVARPAIKPCYTPVGRLSRRPTLSLHSASTSALG